MSETPVKEPPEVKPDTPEPEQTEPVYKCRNCPATASDPEDLCFPMRLA